MFLLTTNQFNVYLRDMIERSVRRIFAAFAAEVLAAIREIRPQNSLHLPEASYPVASSPDPAFNRDLNRSFISSTSYTFQGITARYNIARFAALETRFDQVHIIVANPVELDSVVTRLMNRRFGAEAGARRAELAQRVRADVINDIWTAVVGAHQCWQKAGRIEFCFLADPPVDRAEIFDNDMFLARFSDPASRSFEFPATCRFLKDSMVYQMLHRDCAMLFTSRYKVRIEIPRDDDPGSLIRTLRAVGLQLSEAQYRRYQTEFWEL